MRTRIHKLDPAKIKLTALWLVYLRVSTDQQTYQRQTKRLKRDQLTHKFTVDEQNLFVDDGISASIKGKKVRGDYRALFALIHSGAVDGATLWLAEFSRVIRNMEEYGDFRKLCREHGIRLYLTEDERRYDLNNDVDRSTIDKKAAEAEAEITTLAARVRSSVPVTIEMRLPYGLVPYGYRRIYDPESGDLIGQEPHPEHAPVVRELCRRYACGESVKSITAWLNATAECPRNANASKKSKRRGRKEGARWHEAGIGDRAVMGVYVGQRVYRGSQDELIATHDMVAREGQEGGWEPLIDLETHLACVERKARSELQHSGERNSRWLSGVAACSVSEDHVVRAITVKGITRYTCRTAHCFKVPADLVDTYVYKFIRDEFSKDWTTVTATNNSVAVMKASEELAAARTDYAELLADADAGEVTRTGFKALERPAIRRVEAAEKALVALTVSGPLRALAAVEDPWTTFMGMGLHERREATRELLSVTLSPAGVGNRVTEAGISRVVKVKVRRGE